MSWGAPALVCLHRAWPRSATAVVPASAGGPRHIGDERHHSHATPFERIYGFAHLGMIERDHCDTVMRVANGF